jgi:hypothetical protein
MKYAFLPALLALSACGGSSSPELMDQQQQQQQRQQQQQQQQQQQAGPQLVSPLNLTATETFSTFSFDTYNAAPAATINDLIESQVSGVANYSGSMLARLGTESEFLSATVNMSVGFQAQTMAGFLRNLQFSGADAADREDIGPFRSLELSGGTFDGNELAGTMSGSFIEGNSFGFAEPADEHTVSADLSLVFVDPARGDGETAVVGTIDGTITSTSDGTRSMVGIIAADNGF